MPDNKITKYITFRFQNYSTSGKTEQWHITNNSSQHVLASIYWYGPWRQYVMEPREDTVWNTDCLKEIQTFLTERNIEQKNHATLSRLTNDIPTTDLVTNFGQQFEGLKHKQGEDDSPNVDTRKMKQFRCGNCSRWIHHYPCAFCTYRGFDNEGR